MSLITADEFNLKLSFGLFGKILHQSEVVATYHNIHCMYSVNVKIIVTLNYVHFVSFLTMILLFCSHPCNFWSFMRKD